VSFLVHTVVLGLRSSQNKRIFDAENGYILKLNKYEGVLNKNKPTLLQVRVSMVLVRFLGRFMAI